MGEDFTDSNTDIADSPLKESKSKCEWGHSFIPHIYIFIFKLSKPHPLFLFIALSLKPKQRIKPGRILSKKKPHSDVRTLFPEQNSKPKF